MKRDEANPATMPDRALDCAILACQGSAYASDREFAKACAAELERRMAQPERVAARRWHRELLRRAA